jgi:uncharacterized protein YlzI (FlbEa/FlbD family)
MLLIPIHTLLEDNPGRHPRIFEELGVSKDTVINLINGKHSPQKQTVKAISSKIAKTLGSLDGVIINQNLFEEALSTPGGISSALFHQSLNDVYLQYYYLILKKILRLDDCFQKELLKASTLSIEDQESLFVEVVRGFDFPGKMLNDNWIEENELTFAYALKTLNRVRIDILFYLFSAHDFNWAHCFGDLQSKNKSLFSRYLPKKSSGEVKKPLTIWFDSLIEATCKRESYKKQSKRPSIRGFANYIAPSFPMRSSDSVKLNKEAPNLSSVEKRIHDWRSLKRFPTWKNVNRILEAVCKDEDASFEVIESTKEYGRLTFAYAKFFQKIYDLMMEGSEKIDFNEEQILKYFDRYLYWHNYHSINFLECSGQGGADIARP